MNIYNMATSYSDLKQTKLHTHNEWELILNLQGSGVSYIGGEQAEFHPGTISVCPPGVPHRKATKKGYFQDVYVTFDGDQLFRHLNGKHFADDPDGKIRTLLLTANGIYHNGDQTAAALLVEAVCHILRRWDRRDAPDERVALLKNEIIQNFTNPAFKVAQAMQSTNYCNDHVRRCFKKELGITPVQYLNRLRIEHAKKMLQQNTTPRYFISDVAGLSGFSDTGYFSRVFKKTEGISPAQFVERIS